MKLCNDDDVVYWRQRAEKLLTYNIQLKQQVNDTQKLYENLLEKFNTLSTQCSLYKSKLES